MVSYILLTINKIMLFNSNNSVRSKKIDLFLTAELGTARDNFLDNVTNLEGKTILFELLTFTNSLTVEE